MIFVPNNIELLNKLHTGNYPAKAYPLNASNQPKIKIGILNIMPNKIETEYHFSSILSQVAEDIEIYFLRLKTQLYKNTSEDYLRKYYFYVEDKIDEVDLLIFTGAPLEEINFEQVNYWDELKTFFKYIQKNKIPIIQSCWSAMASLYYYHNIPKHILTTKSLGIFEHQILNNDKVAVGLITPISFPISRFADMDSKAIQSNNNLSIILSSNITGEFLIKDKSMPCYYLMGHPEYSASVLKNEYERDMIKRKKGIEKPVNYSLSHPTCFWHQNGLKIYTNIVNELLSLGSWSAEV